MTDTTINIDAVPDEIVRDALRQTTTLQSDGRECRYCGTHEAVYAFIGSSNERPNYDFCTECGEYREIILPPNELIEGHTWETSTDDFDYVHDTTDAAFEDMAVVAKLRDRLRDAIGDDAEWIILHRTELESDSDSNSDASTESGRDCVDDGREQQAPLSQSKANSPDEEQVNVSMSTLATLADFPYGWIRDGFHPEKDDLYEAVIDAYRLLPEEEFDPPLDQRIRVLSELDTVEKRARLRLEMSSVPTASGDSVDEDKYAFDEEFWADFLEMHREIHDDNRESDRSDNYESGGDT